MLDFKDNVEHVEVNGNIGRDITTFTMFTRSSTSDRYAIRTFVKRSRYHFIFYPKSNWQNFYVFIKLQLIALYY